MKLLKNLIQSIVNKFRTRKFEVGTRVIAIAPVDSNIDTLNLMGVIIEKEDTHYLVEFDQSISKGHSGSGIGKAEHCYWCYNFAELRVLKSKKIKGTVLSKITNNIFIVDSTIGIVYCKLNNRYPIILNSTYTIRGHAYKNYFNVQSIK